MLISRLNRRHVFIFFLLPLVLSPACSSVSQDGEMAGKKFERTLTHQEEWMGAYFQGKKIGYIQAATEEGLLDGLFALRVKSAAEIEMKVENEISRAKLDQSAFIDDEGRFIAFRYVQNIMGHTLTMGGVRKEENLLVEINAGGERRRRTIPIDENTFTATLIKQVLLKRGMKAGEEIELNIFLEPLLTVVPLSLKVLSVEKGFVQGKETRIYTLEESFKGIIGTLRMTDSGLTLEETSPHGFQLLRLGRAEALAQSEPLAIADLLLASRISVKKKIEAPRKRRGLELELKNVPASFTVMEDERQKVVSSAKNNGAYSYRFNITVEEMPEKLHSRLVTHAGKELYLLADHVVNADNGTIISKAESIVGNETSALEASRKIYDWVHKNIRKRLVDTVSALDTLKSGEGECQAHANLYAALARAVGIPARVVSGIVYSEEYGGFMYHAWNEVFVGKWISVDATLGGFPADATHLKLSEGGLADQLNIMTLVGRVEADVLSH